MCQKLIARHRCSHESAGIKKCSKILIENNTASAIWTKWKKRTPLPSCKIVRTDVPKHSFHYVSASLCPSCTKTYGPDAKVDLIRAEQMKQLKIEDERRRVAKEIQHGRYVQPQPASSQSSMPPPSRAAVRTKFSEVGLVPNPTTPLGSRPSTLPRSNAVRGHSSSNTVKQVQNSARPAYGHRRLQSKDFVDMGPDDLDNTKYIEYYRSGAHSGMSFQHPAVAAHMGSKHSQQGSRRAFNQGERLNKPLPLTPPNERNPVSAPSVSTGRDSIHRNTVPYSTSQISTKSQQRECPAADRFESDHVYAQQIIRIPFSGSGAASPVSDREADRARWPSPNCSADAFLRPGPRRTPQIVRNQLFTLDGVSPLVALSALIINSEADDYFVPSHTNNGKGKGKAPIPSHSRLSPATPQTPQLMVTRTRKEVGRPFPPQSSNIPQAPRAENIASAEASYYSAQPACLWTSPNSITGSPPLLSSAVYCPPPLPPARDPTDDTPDEVDDAVDFEFVAYKVNMMAAEAEVRNRVTKWQGSSAPSNRTHSRRHSREQRTVQTTPGFSLRPRPLQSRKPTSVAMRNSAPDGKGGFFDKAENR